MRSLNQNECLRVYGTTFISKSERGMFILLENFFSISSALLEFFITTSHSFPHVSSSMVSRLSPWYSFTSEKALGKNCDMNFCRK